MAITTTDGDCALQKAQKRIKELENDLNRWMDLESDMKVTMYAELSAAIAIANKEGVGTLGRIDIGFYEFKKRRK